jgi:DNA uptake protein ComE-like DNA-binding protein
VPARKQFAAAGFAVLAVSLCLVADAARGRPQSAAPQTATKAKPIPPPEARVDINHASADELLKVPGMTPSWAGRIVRFRPYRTKQDLLDRGVLPSNVYDRIKDYVIAHRDKD